MRALVLTAALVAATASSVAASPAEDGEKIRVQTNAVLAAFDAKRPAVLLAALAPSVEIMGLHFTDKKCAKAFADDTVVTGKVRAKLVKCLLAGPARPTKATRFEVVEYRDTWSVDLEDGTALLQVRVRVTDGTPAIHSLLGPDLGEMGGVAGEDVKVAGGVVRLLDNVQPVTITSSTPPPPTTAKPAPQNVPPTALEALRIAGDKYIEPADVTRVEIARAGKTRIVSSFKLCVDATGTVTGVTMLKSSGFPAYDTKVKAGMKTWGYRPYEVDGTAVPVCTTTTFLYSPK